VVREVFLTDHKQQYEQKKRLPGKAAFFIMDLYLLALKFFKLVPFSVKICLTAQKPAE